MKKLFATILAFLFLSIPCYAALEFVGATSQYVEVADSNSLDLADVSISFWIKTTSTASDPLISKIQVAPPNRYNYDIWLEATTGFVYTQTYDGATNPIAKSTSAVNDGNEHHVVSVREATGNTLKIYVDVIIEHSVADTLGDITNGEALYFATYRPKTQYSDSILWDIRIYNRVLSIAEISNIRYLYGIDNIVDGVVGWWRMNELPSGVVATGANTVIDISGQGNHGTPANLPVYEAVPMTLTYPQIN